MPTTAPTTPGLHHVALAVRDPGAARAFYEEALGFVPAPEWAGGDGARAVLSTGGGAPGTLLALESSGVAAGGRPGIGGLHHTAFGVADDPEILRWKRRLTDLGVPVSGPYDRGYFTSIYFRDPDGQILEIATEGPGYALDEPEERLGTELTVPPQRIVRGHRDEAAIAALTHPEPVPEIAEEMRLQGIHHVSGITDNLDLAGALFEETLGLSRVKRTVNRDDPSQLHYFWAARREGALAPHSTYTLFGWPPVWNRARAGVGQTLRVALRAGGHPLEAWAARLRERGVEVEGPREDGPARALSFRMHDGQPLEIAEDSPAS